MYKIKEKKSFFSDLILFFIVLWWVIPTFSLFINSLRAPSNIMTVGWWNIFLEIKTINLNNYIYILKSGGMLKAFFNSLIISIPATLFTVILAAMAAYPLSFYKFPCKNFIYIFIIALQIIPLQITLIPVLSMLKDLKLAGTFPGIWMAHTAYGLPFSIYLFRNFFANIPLSLVESAQIDGSSKNSIFFRIILPLSTPVIASLTIFQFLWVWNDLLVALVILGGSESVAPLTVKLTSLKGSLEAGWNILSAGAFITMFLPLLIFLSLQKYFIKGILAGSIKG